MIYRKSRLSHVGQPANVYHLTYSYDLLGDMLTKYNDREGVTYSNTYDTAARLTKFQSNLVDSNHPGTLLTVNQYNPLGEIQQATLGNGIVHNAAYDKLGRITSRTDGSLYSFSLGYAPDSNILTGNDSVNGNWTYSYDDFNRVATSSKSGQAFNYQYDRFSNRWKQNVTAGSGPQPSYTFDANNHITNSGISYDSAGNVMNDGFHSYAYDAEGHLMSVDAGSTAAYLYNASGQRVESTTPSSTVDFIFDQAGRVITEATSGSWARSELYAGGLHVASYTNATTYFDHSDWLGTVRALSTVSGANYQNCSSLPFGDAQTCTGSPWYALQFTGDEHDNESNLENTWFRQYTGTQGRWISPDPAGTAAVDPTNPQTWNRYAYLMNNPINWTDPLGLENDCGGPCVNFSQMLGGGCFQTITYTTKVEPDGINYDIPQFGPIVCGLLGPIMPGGLAHP